MDAVARFDWDPEKAEANFAKHGVRFEEVVELFSSGIDYLEIFDEAHSIEEERFLAVGLIAKGVVVVVWTDGEEDIVRIISARIATPRERKQFEARMVKR